MAHLNKSQEWFEEKVKGYHGNKVEILSRYNGSEKPIDIIYHCENHGDTYKTLNAKNICKTYFNPCKSCQNIHKSESNNGNSKEKSFYLKRLQEYCISNGGYLVSTIWTKAKDLYEIKCGNPNHPTFWSNADSLVNKPQWCPYCSGRAGEFENEIKDIIHSKNGELLSEYKGSGEYVKVRCNKHNHEWDVLPNNIKKGRWCCVCNMGFSEKVVWDYFKKNQCNVIPQYTFDDLLGSDIEKLRFDFAILSNKGKLIYLVEIDDEEHSDNHNNCERRLIARMRDVNKDQYCIERDIKLYRMKVPFRTNKKWDYDDYYRYINTELKFIVNLANLKNEEELDG
jgi:hypothetical protein